MKTKNLIAFQVNGKTVAHIAVGPDSTNEELQDIARNNKKVEASIGNRVVQKVIIDPKKVVNIIAEKVGPIKRVEPPKEFIIRPDDHGAAEAEAHLKDKDLDPIIKLLSDQEKEFRQVIKLTPEIIKTIPIGALTTLVEERRSELKQLKIELIARII